MVDSALIGGSLDTGHHSDFLDVKTQTSHPPIDRLLHLSQHQFTGKFSVTTLAEEWNFFYCSGRLIWANGGRHPNRRFHRLWKQFCANVPLSSVKLRPEDYIIDLMYHTVAVAFRRQMVDREQSTAVVREVLREVLFDILGQGQVNSLDCTQDASGSVDSSLSLIATLLRLDEVVPAVQEVWEEWKLAGMATVSGNSAPVIKEPERLKKVAAPKVCEVLFKVVDGRHTLREIAIAMQRDLLRTAKSLLPYIQRGIIELVEIPDFAPLIMPPPPPQTSTPVRTPLKPLIACIDDSPQIGRQMQEILVAAGYRLIWIQEAIQALPMLLENKPELIFLDITMPIANGYEICAQIRRVEAFKHIPIAISTSNDGAIDRVRSKLVGATDFIAKPLDAEKVLGIVQKYLGTIKERSNQSR
ncbi:MAG: response regulator [Coleofasciculaceae cyanobacterium SM2_3_26]|nr:response regulator [Coleofasciculaceae cyanobacterium SM2_3_26]